MLSIFCLFLLIGLGNAAFQTPKHPPSITVRYEDGNIIPSIELEYINRPPVKYTYDIRFSRWGSSSSLYLSEPYSNRVPSTGSWEQLWEKKTNLDSSAISGSYGAWPLPAPYWNHTIVGKNTVRYTGRIPLTKLLNVGLVDLEVTATHFVYKGILFTHYLQPIRESVYSVTSYSRPFIVSLDRKTEGVGGMEVFPVEVSILNSEAIGLTGLMVGVETITPTLGEMSYGRLELLSVTGRDTLTSIDYEKYTPCHPEDGSQCRQVWTLSLNRTSGGYYNETYTLDYGLESCLVSSPENCIYTDTSVKIGLLISGGSATISHVSTLAVEKHNITYYYDSHYSQQRLERDYVAGETIRFRHLSKGEYELELWNLWICSTVENGIPPSLGARRGCSGPENIDGTVNIPEHMQWQLLTEGTYTDAAERFNFQLQGKDAASLDTGSLTGSIYLHLESRAVKVTPSILRKEGKYEMGAVIIDSIHTLTIDTDPVWVWSVVGIAVVSMSIGAFYAYRRGKKKSFLTGTVRV